MKLSGRLLCPVILMLAAVASLRAQTQITLTPTSVIGGSPVFSANRYNDAASAYQAGNIFNQQSGTVDMTSQQNNAWFPSEDFGTTNRYVTIDLGASYVLSSIQIFNSNQADRGTGHFSLSGGNAIVTGPADGFLTTGSAVSSPVTILGSTALTYSTVNPVTGQSFAISDTTAYRYLTLTAIDVPSGGGFSNVGLAEVRIFGSAIPEPSTYAAIFGAVALGCAYWRRRRTAGTVRAG